jgi:Zn-dependent peptidase ImmA (M78 family)
MKIERMDLADFGSPDDIAAQIVRLEPTLPIPIPIEELAFQLDIKKIEPFEDGGFEGALITTQLKPNGIILFNPSSISARKRFTIAHELGHFLIPSHVPPPGGFKCTAKDMMLTNAVDKAARMELEANRFAAHMLMPTKMFRDDIYRLRHATLEAVIELARKYDTSREATARRFINLHDEVCAIVQSRNDSVISVYRSRRFPYLWLDRGTAVPAGSITRSYQAAVGEVSPMEGVDPAIWLSGRSSETKGELFEQVLIQKDGFRMTLLVFETHEEEDETWS